MHHRLTASIVTLLTGVALWTTAVPAEAAPRRVLLLYSYEREYSHFTFARMFRPELSNASAEPVEFIELSLQTIRSSLSQSDESMLDDLRGTFAGRPFDLVVPIGGPAAAFIQKYRGDLFPQTPVLLAAVDNRFVQSAALSANETAVMVRHDPPRMIESILRVLPDTKTVVVIIGASKLEQFWLHEVQRGFRRFEGRLNFIWTNQMSLAELLRKCGSLPPHSVIFYGILSLDAAGAPQIEQQTLAALHSSANAPLFGLHSQQLGSGIVGGPLLSLPELSHDSATVALRLLDGEPAARIAPVTLVPGTPTFDWRELRRWGIPESRLQPGSVVEFRELTVWQRNRAFVATAVTFFGAQTLLVLALAVAVVKQKRAAADRDPGVRTAEATLARLSQRLMDAQEKERAWIARTIHDDVCQQMTALRMRLEALGQGPGDGAGGVRTNIEDLSDQFAGLEREILAISDPVYARLRLLGLAAAARAFCEQRCANALQLDFQAGSESMQLSEHVALAVFRVMQGAVDNALAHARASHLSVALAQRDGSIELEVTDDGVGFDPPAVMDREAVGLVGIRERIRQVGGTLTIESRPGAGTRVRARAPRG